MTTVYLNDFSLYGGDNTSDDWKRFFLFYNLIAKLRSTGIERIIAPNDIYDRNICGFSLSNYRSIVDGKEIFDKQKRQTLITFVGMLQAHTSKLNEYFMLTNRSCFNSSLLAEASLTDKPIISVTFNPIFERDILGGYLCDTNGNISSASVNNIWEDTSRIYTLFNPIDASTHDPYLEPLWNQKPTVAYMQSIAKELHESTHRTYEEKVAALQKHGTIVAEMNGWKLSVRVSNLNSTADKHRVIFVSDGFKRKAYLCIDFENTDLCFELNDRNGNWVHEIGWNGSQSKGKNLTKKQQVEQAKRHKITV